MELNSLPSNEIYEKSKLMPTDWFNIRIKITYRFADLIRVRYSLPSGPTITCENFFSQEGQDHLRTQLSQDPHLVPEVLDSMIPYITYRVQRLFKSEGNPEVENPSPSRNPRGYSLYLHIEFQVPEEDEDEVIEQSLQEVRMIPASNEAVNLLRTFNFNGQKDEHCTICMEEFDSDNQVAEVSMMPCDHIFHQQCIMSWLQISHMCPLCRYSMPVVNQN
ncbi:hypothetical protein RJT34_04201 [Clitoria ternatea]|uniref:RING-type E3 ubiquitin transferase n=1 Tax=Clitoria ternatea TaxID=43366 RepID=A0AAN9KKH1_CLITE